VAHHLLLISGSLREASTNTASLRVVARVAPADVTTTMYERLGQLPAFNPDDDAEPLHPEVAALRAAIHSASAAIFSTPEYAGALPGSFKNLLDWTIGDDQPGSIYNKPVSWINTSPRGAQGAYDELRTVLTYAHATIVQPACVHLPVASAMISPDGQLVDAVIEDRLAEAVRTLVSQIDE
jgi:NAD(P)H-dependent FMN reductase